MAVQKHNHPDAAGKTFEYILENIPEGTIVINAGTKKISACNPVICRMLGCTNGDLLNRFIYRIHPEDSLPLVKKLYDQILKKPGPLKNVKVKRKDGSLFQADISSSLIEYNGLPHLMAIFKDMTDQVAARDIIQNSEERFKALFMSINEGFYFSEIVYDKSGRPCDYRFLEVNPKFEQISRLSRDQLIGKRYKELVKKEDIPASWLNAYFKAALTGEPQVHKYFLNYNDEMRYFINYAYKLNSEQIAVFVLDISESVYSARELADARLLLDTAVMQAPVPAVIASAPDSILRFVNRACLEYLGVTDEPSYVGRSFYEIEPTWKDYDEYGNLVPLAEIPFALALRGVETRNRVWRTVRKDGTERWNQINASPVRNSEGRIIAAYLVFQDITERKLAEDELRKSQNFLMSIIDQSPVSTWISDSSGTMLKMNNACRKLFNIRDEDVVGKYNVLNGEMITSQGYRPLVKTVFEKGETVNFELVYDSSQLNLTDAVSVVLEVNIFPVKDESGNITNAVIQHNNITERRHMEYALQKTASELQLILKNMLNAFIIWEPVFDRNGKYISCRFGFFNDSYARISGLRQKDVLGKDVLEVWPDTEQSWIDIYGKVALTGIPVTFDMYHKSTGGWYHVNAYRPADSEDQVCAIFEDITDRINAEEELRKNEAVLKSLFNAAPVGICLMTDRRFVKVNNSMCSITGYSEEELVGNSTRLLYLSEAEYIRVGTELAVQLNKEELGHIDTQFRRRDGKIIDVLLYISSFETGDLSNGIVGAISDITEVKRIGAEKARLEEMLFRAQKMEAIGAMAGGIAHDFNNILAGIFGFAELSLGIEGNPPENAEYVRGIIKAAERAKDLTSRILTFSRQAGQELMPVMPKYIIDEVFKLLRASIPAEVALNIKVKSKSVIMAEPTMLHQVLMNLCSNAVYAMNSGQGSIDLTLEDVEADEAFARLHPGLNPGKHIVIRISDTGSGIAPEIINQIFDPFFTTKPQGEGTGLGLSVVHGIVKKLKGAISVYSEPGKGTAFNIFIPAIVDKTIEVRRSDSIIKGGTENILLVDDEDVIINVFGSILNNLGYKVKAFTDCKKALDEFRNNPEGYDIVITDYSMPFMTGIELVRKMKEVNKDIPIILNSGYFSKSVEESAAAEKINILLTKPVGTYQIADAIRRALSVEKNG